MSGKDGRNRRGDRHVGGRPAALVRRAFLALIGAVLAAVVCAGSARAQDDILKLIESRQADLNRREEALKQETRRLEALKSEVNDRIERYNSVLTRLETLLARIEKAEQDRIQSVVKAYESMPPEDAASRIESLDDGTAVLILQGMKSKKSGAVMAVMNRHRAADLTHQLTKLKPEPVAGRE